MIKVAPFLSLCAKISISFRRAMGDEVVFIIGISLT